jgi:two-component system, cell cycle sensor histidine kinase and response regulator CckA
LSGDEQYQASQLLLEPLLELGPVSPCALPWQVEPVLDAIHEGLQIIDFEWRYVYINASAARHGRLDKAELIGRSMLEAYPGIEKTELFGHLDRCMRERVSHRMDNEFTQLNGQKEWFELRIEPLPHGVLVVSVEIGERRLLEEQLAHAQKMEAVGRLAGGVAHDFNNLLTVIISYAEFMTSAVGDDSELRRDLEEIRSAATRGAKLTHQLLAFSRRQVLAPTVISPNLAIRELEPMLRRLCGESVGLHSMLSARTGAIRVDPGQLDQVLMNLVANARDAMPNGGEITVRTDLVELDETYSALHSEVKPGPYVLIAVSDNGCGMDAATLARMFEPFFTTKPAGHGTGLGLATSHGIVRQNGGHIWAYSEPGKGSTFKLYFPLVGEAVALGRSFKPALPVEQRGHEVVMVVDDEATLRTLCVRALKERGYTVLEAETPSEALRFAARYSGRIDLLLSDVVMPGLSGPQLAAELASTRPELRVLYMSGYAEHDMLAELETKHCLEKPFTPEMLARTLRQVLSAALDS